MVVGASKMSDTNLGNIQVRNCRFNFCVEVSLNFACIQFNDERKARRLLADVLNRPGFPPSPNGVDGEQIPPSEI